jgi:hypothetical protein
VPSLSPLVPPSSCWRTLGVDLIVDLPRSQAGFTAICVFVCHRSKMVRLVPTTNDLSASVSLIYSCVRYFRTMDFH